MTFYLLSRGLSFFGYFSGAYQSFKVLKHDIERRSCRDILIFWSVLSCISIYEDYLEFFISWFPFYYLVKCMCLAFIVIPRTNVPEVCFDFFILPLIQLIELHYEAQVKPVVDVKLDQWSHRLNEKFLHQSLDNMNLAQVHAYEKQIRQRLRDVHQYLEQDEAAEAKTRHD